MHIKRHISVEIAESKKSVLLLGPRQTGKSTLLQSLRPTLTINLSDEETYFKHLKDPALLKQITERHKLIFVDEVQRLPQMLNTLQFLIDNSPAKKFLLSGSSARKLKRGQANLLPGRIINFNLGPLSPTELSDDQLSVSTALRKGFLPGIYLEEDEKTWQRILRSYATNYLKEEIQAEALTKDLAGFSRFFVMAAARSGDLLDFSKISSQAEINRVACRRYFDILNDTLITKEVPAFANSQKKRLVQHSKFYFFDVGVLNACLNNFEASQDRRGTLFEHLVLQCIVSEASARDREVKISNYTVHGGREVDFIIEFGRNIFAIEVKAKNISKDIDTQALYDFEKFVAKPVIKMVIYQGHDEVVVNGVHVLPLLAALKFMQM